MKKINTISRKSRDSDGCLSKTIVTVTENDTVLVKQRFFTEHLYEQAEVLRTWKGMYYIERHLHMYPETFEFIVGATQYLTQNKQTNAPTN